MHPSERDFQKHKLWVFGQHSKCIALHIVTVVDKRNKTGDVIVLDDYTYGKFDGVVKLAEEVKFKKNYNLDFLDENKDRGYVILKKKWLKFQYFLNRLQIY